MSENTADTPRPDPFHVLRTSEVAAADLADWRLLAGRLKARFVRKDYAAGLEFVAAVGAAAQAADHHPDLTLTYGDVVVALSSHDVHGVTVRDVRMARRISDLAREHGLRSEPTGLSVVEIGLDTARDEEHGRFYAALLGAETVPGGSVEHPGGQTPALWWQGPEPASSAGHFTLPKPEVEQRWHLDVWVAPEEAQPRLQAVLDAGGRLLSDASAPAFWVVEDVEGNRSCICTALRPDHEDQE